MPEPQKSVSGSLHGTGRHALITAFDAGTCGSSEDWSAQVQAPWFKEVQSRKAILSKAISHGSYRSTCPSEKVRSDLVLHICAAPRNARASPSVWSVAPVELAIRCHRGTCGVECITNAGFDARQV